MSFSEILEWQGRDCSRNVSNAMSSSRFWAVLPSIHDSRYEMVSAGSSVALVCWAIYNMVAISLFVEDARMSMVCS